MNHFTGLLFCMSIGIPIAFSAQDGGEDAYTAASGPEFYDTGYVNWELLLSDKDVRKILELTEDQERSLESLRNQIGKKRHELVSESIANAKSNRIPTEQRNAELSKTAMEYSLKLQAELDSVLLPIQTEQLENSAIERAFSSGMVAKVMGRILRNDVVETSEAKIREIENKAVRLERELDDKIFKLRLDAWNRFVSGLNDNQKSAVTNRLKVNSGR